MKKAKKLLKTISLELVEGKDVLRAEKKKLKRTKTPLKKENKKRAIKVIKKAVESLEDHRKVLKQMTSARQRRAWS